MYHRCPYLTVAYKTGDIAVKGLKRITQRPQFAMDMEPTVGMDGGMHGSGMHNGASMDGSMHGHGGGMDDGMHGGGMDDGMHENGTMGHATNMHHMMMMVRRPPFQVDYSD